MSDERFEDLTPEERAAFESVSRPVAPPPECEDAIVASLRERDLIRDDEREPGAWSFTRLLPRWAPRVALATAALAGTFFLGATYGRNTAPQEAPAAVQLDLLPGLEEAQGEMFKDENGELVLTALETQGVRPDAALALAVAGKPPVDRDDLGALVGMAPGDLDASFSLRHASR